MGQRANGTTLKIGDGVTPTEGFTTVAELTSIGMPEFGTGTIETTSFDSTEEEHISDGIQSHGEVAIEGNWVPAHATQDETAGLLKKAIDGAVTDWKIDVPAGAVVKTFAFSALLKFSPTVGGPRDALKFSGTLKITGPIIITSV